MSTMRVATTQFELRVETSARELVDHMRVLITEAATGGAELVVFPELVDTGLLGTLPSDEVTADTLKEHYWTTLPKLTDEIISELQPIAREQNITVLAGSFMRLDDDGVLRNTAYLLGADGSVQTQDKIHLTPQEHELGLTGGDSVTLVKIGERTAGMLICADIQFPELSRYLSANGAELILCPSLTWNSRGEHRVRLGCRARAVENQAFVVLSTLVGSSGLPVGAAMHAVGESVVATPIDKTFRLNDGILAISGDRAAETIVFADLDFDLLRASRAKPEAPGLSLQRPDVYAKLVGA